MTRCPPRFLALILAAACPILLAEEPSKPETQRRMEEILRERSVKAEADRATASHLLAQGRRLKDEGRLEEAAASLEKAAQLMPSDREIRDELDAVRSALGATADRRHEILEELARSRAAREDQQKAMVDGKVREGQRLMGEHNYAEAVRVLKEAQETVRWMAYGSPEVDRLRNAVADLLKEAERGGTEEEARRREAQIRQAEAEATREFEATKAQGERRISALREHGAEALRNGRWDEAERISHEIEALQPGDAAAAHLKLLARERRHVAARTDLKKSYAEEWRNLSEFAREQQTPYSREVMRHPDNWTEEHKHGAGDFDSQDEQEPQWKQQLRERLRQPVHYKFDGIPFRDAKEYLETQGRVVINVDRSAQEAQTGLDDTPIHLTSPEMGMSLESALQNLTRHVNLKWTLREETIVITTEAGLKEPPGLKQYDVRDLIGQILDYEGPTITIGGGNSSPGVSFDKVSEPDEEKKVTGETLKDFIKEYVDKTVWSEEGNSIEFKNGRLFVTAPQETHKKIKDVLKGFRDQRTLQVLIQARFITIQDTTFEEVGVDWRGLATGAPLDSIGSLPTPQTGNAASTPAGPNLPNPAANRGPQFAGFSSPAGLRTSATGGIVNQGQYLGGAAGSSGSGSIFPRSIGGAAAGTTTLGGLGMQIAFLDNFQAQAVITAVEKNRKANILTSPTLLCFNTQRANMVSVVQAAYVQDVTAVVQVQIATFDPDIGYVQTGIVFDVRPIVSADRKYITLELRPTVSALQLMREIRVNGPFGASAVIEAPQVQLQAIRTTVSVPDGGTLMIGGLTDFDETHNYSSVPFLSKIPFLRSLFGGVADAKNRNSLVILVKAQVIDQKEIEEEKFGKE